MGGILGAHCQGPHSDRASVRKVVPSGLANGEQQASTQPDGILLFRSGTTNILESSHRRLARLVISGIYFQRCVLISKGDNLFEIHPQERSD